MRCEGGIVRLAPAPDHWPGIPMPIRSSQLSWIASLMAASSSKTRVAIVAFDGISPFHLSVPCIVFGDALGVDSPFEVLVCPAETAH